MKRVPRVYVDLRLEADAIVTVTGAPGHHLVRVLRAKAGDPVVLFNGRGGEYHGVVESADARSANIGIESHRDTDNESPLAITLVQGLSRAARMDYTIQKATELGVATIAPVATHRSVMRLDEQRAEKRTTHWHSVAVSACEQCGRNRLPTLTHPVSLEHFLANGQPFTGGLLLDPRGEPLSRAPIGESRTLTLLVGPEGGLEPAERDAAAAAGFRCVSLGPRVLRTETAATVALSVLQYLGGDLGGTSSR